MSIYDKYSEVGKNNIKATRDDFIEALGDDNIKEIIVKVLLGGNVRDITEFITQRRLMNSYAALIELFANITTDHDDVDEYANYVTNDLQRAKGDEKIIDLWLLGLTKKGLDNIVRSEDNIRDYKRKYTDSMKDIITDFTVSYGNLTGILEHDNVKLELSWDRLMRLMLAAGSQTLSIRGSAKSMNGKLFEKLVLGSLLVSVGFEYIPEPPDTIDPGKRLFWLSHMDENERETDATVVYGGQAISIDIGFIGKGNPEITLDKVTRFGSYKQIGGIDHDMSIIIIVDTVADNSDLFNKAARVNGHVFQMKKEDWTISFANQIKEIFDIDNELASLSLDELESFFLETLKDVNIRRFL